MISKDEALQYVRSLAAQKVVTKEELVSAFDAGTGTIAPTPTPKKAGVSDVLYYVGGGIVFIGIAIYLGQNWSSMDATTKLLVSLGAGIAAYVSGLLLGRDQRTEGLSTAFHLIAALTLPLGLHVCFDLAGFNTVTAGTEALIMGILAATYIASYLLLRKNSFMLFAILFSTGLFFSMMSLISQDSVYASEWQFYVYQTFTVGLSYLALGYAFAKTTRASLSGFLYGFGAFMTLVAALSLGGWQPAQNALWEVLFPGIVFGMMFLSVHLQRRILLTWSTIFLMLYILKITAEYFQQGLGWPLSLVIAGFGLMGAGYLAVSLGKKYLPGKQKTPV